MITDYDNEIMYKCPRCGEYGLPSVWTFVKKNGEAVGLCTGCANDLRHKYGDGKNMTIVEKP